MSGGPEHGVMKAAAGAAEGKKDGSSEFVKACAQHGLLDLEDNLSAADEPELVTRHLLDGFAVREPVEL